MNNKFIVGVAGAFLLLSVLYDSFFIIDQRQTALVLQLGEPVAYRQEPGINLKMPFVQNAIFFDKRIQNLVADTTEVIASDQKTMRMDAFTKYRIIDGLKFFQSAKDERGFKSRLAPILDSSLRQVLGSVPFTTLLTSERTVIMKKIQEIVNREAKDFGVEIVDVRITRADLPDNSKESVYDRMRSERKKEAQEIRAEGDEAAQKIISTADKDKQIILSEGKKRGEILKGEGDAGAIKIFADAFNKDPEFFDFYRSMQAYKKSINKDSSKTVLSSDTEFLKYFKKSSYKSE